MISEADKQALTFAGLLGHPYVSVRSMPDGKAFTNGEYNSRASVKRLVRVGERVYHKTKSGWSRVRSLEAK